MHCLYEKICSGCPWIELPITEQIERKKQSFWSAWDQAGFARPQSTEFVLIDENGLRDRVDLVLQDSNLSLYQKNSHQAFEMHQCPAMSKKLHAWFLEFKAFQFPIKKGSLRLRVSPQGQRGAWLDFANADIKNLFEEKNILLKLLDVCFVEVGQRRKKLFYDGERLRLGDPEYHPWTETSVNGEALLLQSLVSSFSQTGHKANQRLVQEIEKFAAASLAKNWVEFGAGSGNLTFPLSGGKRKVLALEFDPLALRGLEKTLAANSKYKDFISVDSGDFQRKKQISFENFDGILVNPPRSGLINFLAPLHSLGKNQRPKNFIYMSCYRDSFVSDSQDLHSLGYQPTHITLVDQFPQSPHCEILSSWQLH